MLKILTSLLNQSERKKKKKSTESATSTIYDFIYELFIKMACMQLSSIL